MKECVVLVDFFYSQKKFYSPTPGIEPGPPGWKPGILAIRPCGIDKIFTCERWFNLGSTLWWSIWEAGTRNVIQLWFVEASGAPIVIEATGCWEWGLGCCFCCCCNGLRFLLSWVLLRFLQREDKRPPLSFFCSTILEKNIYTCTIFAKGARH